MKLWDKNPRQITEQQFKDLKRWLEELGDLSGIVHDLNSDMIIGGNQRSRVFDINECEIVLNETFDEPDKQGTVGIGYVIWKGAKYAYRQVRWDAGKCEAAGIIANKAGGDFDMDNLANWYDPSLLLNWGFTKGELGLWEGETKSLDELRDEFGSPNERDFWPEIRLRVAPETFDKFKSVMDEIEGEDEAKKFDEIISCWG
jgi:hypothetical protein